MLPSRSHWHIARERDPLREGRLLAFAGEGEDGGVTSEEENPDTDNAAAAGAAQPQTNANLPPNAAADPVREQGVNATEQGQARTEAATAQHQQGTRSQVQATISPTPETQRTLRVSEVLSKLENTIKQVSGLHARMLGVHGFFTQATNLDAKTREQWKEDEELLALELVRLQSEQTLLQTLERWEALRCAPAPLFDAIDRYMAHDSPLVPRHWNDQREAAYAFLDERKAMRGDMANQAIAHMQGSGSEETHTQSSRIEIDREARDIQAGITTHLPIQEILQGIQLHIDTLEEGIKQSDTDELVEGLEKLQAEEKQREASANEVTLWQGMKTFPRKIGLTLYSVYDVIEAYKQVKEAYLDAWQQRVRLKSAGLANMAGKAFHHLPYGEDVEQVLESSIMRKNDEVKDQYLNFLKNRNVSFRGIFTEPGNVFSQNRHDPNRARAVLEYAASKGWLYHIEDEEFVPIDNKRILRKWSFRELLPAEWDEARANDYYSKLLAENSSGAAREQSGAYDKIKDREDTNLFITNIETELDGLNLWAALGIVKRALERGLRGEVSPWIATTIYRKMQESSELRSVIPRLWLDKVGSLGAYASYMTAGHMKAERREIQAWLSSGDSNIRNAGELGKAMAMIEEEIRAFTGQSFTTPKQKRDLNDFIAMVLAGQTLDEETPGLHLPAGRKITIFSNRYSDYRNNPKIQGMRDLAEPGFAREDSDYYTQRSDNILCNAVDQIMKHTGNEAFQEATKSQAYAQNIFDLYDELQAKGLTAEAENFRKEMGEKLTNDFYVKLGSPRTTGLAKYKTMKDGKETDRLIYPSLVEEGFIPIESCVQTIWENSPSSGVGLAESILLYFDRDKSLLTKLKSLRDAYVRTTEQAEKRRLEGEYQVHMQDWRQLTKRTATWGLPQVARRAGPGTPPGGAAAGTPAPTLAI